MKIRTALFAIAATLPALPALANPGITIVTESTDARGTTTATMQLDGDHLRVDSEGKPGPHGAGGPHTAIFDAGAHKFYVLQPERKAYIEMSPEKIGEMRGAADAQMAAARAQMEAQMKNMPPEQRKQVEAMMARRGAPGGAAPALPDLSFAATGQHGKFNGIACDMYNVTNAGKMFEIDCIAPWGSLGLTKADFAVFQKFAEAFAATMGSPAASAAGTHQQLHRYPGFPIVRTRTAGDGSKREETVKSIKKGSIDSAVFAIPAGYQKADITSMGHGPAQH